MRSVPIIDLEARQHKTQQRALATELGEAFSTVGFVVLEGHGIEAQWIEDAYDAARAFFSLSEAEKRQFETATRMTGFVPYQTEKALGAQKPDLKEFFDIRREFQQGDPRCGTPGYEPNVWPDDLIPSFRARVGLLWRALDRLAFRLMRPLELYLGYPEGTLARFITDGQTLGRWIHYPPVPQGAEGTRSNEHEDASVISLLPAATGAGLELKLKNGIWVPVHETPKSIVVNVGDALQAFTRGRLTSTTHRVRNPGPGDDSARFACPFFVQANPLASMNPPGLEGDSTYPLAGVFLDERLRGIGTLRTA